MLITILGCVTFEDNPMLMSHLMRVKDIQTFRPVVGQIPGEAVRSIRSSQKILC